MDKESRSSESPDVNETKMEDHQQPHQANDAPTAASTTAAAAAYEPAPPLPQSKGIPIWLDHFNRRDLTTVARCVLAIWVASLLMLITPGLRRIGQATFLAPIVIFIIPPAGNLIIAVIGYLSLLFGMALAWAWGLAAMRAANAVRPDAEFNTRLQELQQEVGRIAHATNNNNTAAIAQKLVHDGFMLDARVTNLYFVMGCVFIYVVSRVRYTFNLAVLSQLFGIIAMDIFMVIGPTLTHWLPTLPETVVLPCACGCAIGIASIMLIFPQSSNHMVLGQLEDLLILLDHPIQTGSKALSAGFEFDASPLKKTKQRALTLYARLQPNLAFLPLDLSRGMWSCDDVKSVYAKFGDVLACTFSLADFQIARRNNHEKIERLRDMLNPPPTASSDSGEAKPVDAHRARLLQNPDLVNALIAPGTVVGSDDMRVALHASSVAVLDATSDAIRHLVEALHLVNANRWFINKAARARLPRSAVALRHISARLAEARERCIADTGKAANDLHGNLFDDNGLLKPETQDSPKKIAGLVVAFVIEEHIIATSAAYEQLTAEVARLLETRTEARVWLPTKLQAILVRVTNSGEETDAPALSGQNITDPDRIRAHTRETQRRIQVVSRGTGIPKKRGNPVARAIAAFGAWLTAPGSIYALRVVVVTIALGIPAVLPSTAGFYYREKGIWALVTAQTCILMYMSDFTFSIITRGVATVVGGVVGLVIWYISAGNGIGNAYGLGAALPFGIVLFVWCRLWLPDTYLNATTLGSSTFAMLIGYSWDMHHLTIYGLPGAGYTAFWRRVVMVLVGFVAAVIVQMLPTPPSGTRHVAKTLANNLHKICDHYALLISHWGQGTTVGDDYRGVRSVITSTGLGVGQSLSSLHTPISMLKFETSISSFDQATLRRAQEILISMNQSLTKLMLSTTTLPVEYQQRLIKHSGIADDVSISNIMSVLVLAKQSLRSGGPLPERIPTPLIATCYGDFCAKHSGLELHRDYMESEDFRRYCMALSSYLTFLHRIDDLVLLLKETVGETHVVHDWANLAESV